LGERFLFAFLFGRGHEVVAVVVSTTEMKLQQIKEGRWDMVFQGIHTPSEMNSMGANRAS